MVDTGLYDSLTYTINGAAMEVHRELGPGFPEKVYQEAMMIALQQRNLRAVKEVTFTVAFHGYEVGEFRVDILVDDAVIVELKALEKLPENCEQQLISYLTASGREVGLLLNFGGASLEHSRVVPPKDIQRSAAYQARCNMWKPAWLQRQKSAQSA